jgi:hypothetical protein
MQKRLQAFILIFLSLSLTLSTVSSVSAANVKDGGKCIKKGQVATSGKNKFVCTLKGKKLSWVLQKAKVASSTVPEPNSDTSKTPSTVIEPAKLTFTSKDGDLCNAGDFKVGYGQDQNVYVLDCGPDKKLHPHQNGRFKVDPYTGKINRNYNFSQFPAEVKKLFTKAWQEVRDNKNAGTPIKFNILYQDGVPASHREIFTQSARVMNENYSGWAKTFSEVYWIVATDKSWAIEQVRTLGAKLGASQDQINEYINVLNSGTIRFKQYEDQFAMNISAQSTGQNGRFAGIPVQVFDSWPNYQGNLFDWHEATHEVFHPLVEDYTLPARPDLHPCWYTEGAASLIGESFGPSDMTFEDQFSRFLSHGGGRTLNGFTWGGDLEFPGENNCSRHSQVYTEGEAITTFLVGLYGWDKFSQWIRVPVGSDWKSHFKNVYGVTVLDFYTRIQPLMQDIYTWLDKQQ